ncbi:MAG: class I SAM-dependent methyltransferase [Candidatus Bathyarchaeia archaeon]|nr:class I SAM-dependent methyltransferase [Candidatus Bathyarchaeia archaeon]
MTYRLAAKFYDLFGSKNDLEFYKELALQSGGKALELGVGTARVAIPLARTGVTVVGIDNSVRMLRVAIEKLAKESAAVRRRVILKRGDMRDFELKQTFSFIYIPASTFDHNITVEDRKRTLNCIYKHLKKDGIFAFDLEQAAPSKPEKSWWIDRKEIEGGKMVVRSVFTRRDLTKRRCSLDLFFDVYKNGKLLERYHEYGEVAIISKDEIIGLLEETGFKVVSVYGDFDKSKYQKDSSKIVLVTKRE